MTIRYNFHQQASNSFHHEQEQSGKGQFLPHAQRYLKELKDLLCITESAASHRVRRHARHGAPQPVALARMRANAAEPSLYAREWENNHCD